MADSKDDYYVILEEMKAQEQSYLESVLIVTSNDVLRNGIIAWQAVKCERIRPSDKGYQEKCIFTNSIDKWNWLWGQTKFDKNHFATVADVRTQDISNLFVRLTALRLIYPNGTIPNTVKGFLRNTLKVLFPQPKEKKVQPKEKKEEKDKKELDK